MVGDLHPIQLQGIRVLELAFSLKRLDCFDVEDLQGIDFPFNFLTGHSEFDLDRNIVTVGVIGEVGSLTEESNVPFYIKVHLLGQFSVDSNKFPLDKLDDWAKKCPSYFVSVFT